jgi:cell division transport system ATP-binding protein
VIEFYHVSKQYVKNVWVLNDVSFNIKKGDFVFLTGVSGAGKTTLLKLIYKDEVPSKGQILIDSTNTSLIAKKDIYKLRRDIGIIFQDFKLLHNRTIYENVALPLLIRGERKSLIEKRVSSALSLVGLSHRRNYLPMHVSGGEQQRAAIARAIVANPKIIIADEPTGNLDTELSIEIFHIFERINANGITVILATHDRHLLSLFPKRIISLDQGRIVLDREGGMPHAD